MTPETRLLIQELTFSLTEARTVVNETMGSLGPGGMNEDDELFEKAQKLNRKYAGLIAQANTQLAAMGVEAKALKNIPVGGTPQKPPEKEDKSLWPWPMGSAFEEELKKAKTAMTSKSNLRRVYEDVPADTDADNDSDS